MKKYKKLSFIIVAAISFLFAAERQGEIKESGSRDGCGYGFIASCYDNDSCYPAGWLSDGQCDPMLACYADDGMDCEAGGDGGWFMMDCAMCESMDNDLTCYDLIDVGFNCFSCGVFDECGECLGDGIGEDECDCDGNIVDECGECGGDGIAEGACDCFGGVIDECGICGGDGNWCSAPTAYDATYTLTEDNMITVYLSASDAEGDALTFSIINNSTNGVVMLDGIAATYMPDANFYGTDSFTFIVNDGLFDSNEATINLVVMAVNDAPYFSSIADAEIDLGDIFIYTLEAQDVDGDALVYQLVNVSGPGIATLAGNVLTVQADEEGEIEITVNVSDGIMTDQETFTLTVVAPACATEYEQGFFDGAATGDVNGDGLLNIVDIVLSVEMILGN